MLKVNSENMILSEKDLNAMDFNFLVKPSSNSEFNCQFNTARSQDHRLHHQARDDDDGFRTPTSSDRKVPAPLKCPPAPRKPKYVPSVSAVKKKPSTRRRVLLDLSAEIEALFPPTVLGDLIAGRIKKFRQGKDSTCLL